jgi:hypothetical protein
MVGIRDIRNDGKLEVTIISVCRPIPGSKD